MPVWPLPQITFRELSSIEEKRPVALLTSQEVWAVLSTQLTLPVLIQAEPADHSRELFDYLADNLPSHVKAIYALGQGAPVQAGKVIAARNHIPLILVPTALESDDALTPFAEVQEADGQLAREVTGPASEIIIDWDLLQTAPEDLRGAGIVDVISIVPALLDWRYAAQKGKNPASERFATWAATVATGLAGQAIKHAPAIGQGGQEALQILLNLLLMTVQLANQLEHQRATEGSEHYLARMLAGQITDPLSHSQLVGPGVLFALALHGQSPESLQEALTSAGVRLDRLRATDVRLLLDNLSAHLAQYNFPYSILNDLDPASEMVSHALDAAGLAIKMDTWQKPEETQPVTASIAPEAEVEELVEDGSSLLDELAAASTDTDETGPTELSQG